MISRAKYRIHIADFAKWSVIIRMNAEGNAFAKLLRIDLLQNSTLREISGISLDVAYVPNLWNVARNGVASLLQCRFEGPVTD